jgi:hypothetical protein
MFKTKLNLLDTVFYNPLIDNKYKWLFSDKKGFIKKKNFYNASSKTVSTAFLNKCYESVLLGASEDRTEDELANDKNLLVAQLTEPDEERLLTQHEFVNTISKGIFAEEVMYQVFRHPLGNNATVRLKCIARQQEGRFIYKFVKTWEETTILSQTTRRKTIRLTASNLVNELRDMTSVLIRALEKNLR